MTTPVQVNSVFFSLKTSRLLLRIAGFMLLCLLIPQLGYAVGSADIPSPNSDEAIAKRNQMLEEVMDKEGFAGSFLSSRFAKKHRDLDEAAKYIEETLKHEPENTSFLRDALKVATLRGDIAAAQAYAHRLKDHAQKEPLIACLLAFEALDKDDDVAARNYLRGVKARGLFAMIQPLLLQWLSIDAANGPITMDEIMEKAGFFEPFVQYQLALMNDVAQHKDSALRFYKLASGWHDLSPFRVVDALSNFYAREGRWDDVAQLIAQYKKDHPEAVLVPRIPSPTDPVTIPLVRNAREGMAEVFFSTVSLLYSDQPALEVFWYLQLALHLRPDFPPAQFMLASLYEQIGNHDRAISIYDSITKKNAFYRRSQIRKALNLEASGKVNDALELLQHVADVYPKNVTALTTRGDILRTHKKFGEAANAYTQALLRQGKVTPDDWGIFYARGICYERDGQWDLAEADFKKALALSPNQPDVLNYLAYSWLTMNRHVAEARDMLIIAVEARPEDAHIIDSLGWAYYMSGDYNHAVELLERAVSLAPLDMAMIDHLGDAYWRTGRAIEAQYQWQRVVQYSDDEALKGAAQKKLDEGLPPFRRQQRQH